MDTKKLSQKQPKTLPVTQLPLVALTEKDMSAVNGGFAWNGG
jgi:hypothetical protein